MYSIYININVYTLFFFIIECDKMSKKELDSRFGKRNKMVTARITEADAEILKKNNISVSLAIEEYIDNNLNVYARQQYILKQKEKELAEIEQKEKEKPALIKEIEDLRKSIGYTLIDGLEVSPSAKASAESFAKKYINNPSIYKDLDNYIETNKKEISGKAIENNLTINAFSKLIYNEFEILNAEMESIEKERKIAINNKYANVSEDISNEASEQISKAVRNAVKQIKGRNPNYKDIDAFIKGSDKFINIYVANCDLNKAEFIRLTKEAFYNLAEI